MGSESGLGRNPRKWDLGGDWDEEHPRWDQGQDWDEEIPENLVGWGLGCENPWRWDRAQDQEPLEMGLELGWG